MRLILKKTSLLLSVTLILRCSCAPAAPAGGGALLPPLLVSWLGPPWSDILDEGAVFACEGVVRFACGWGEGGGWGIGLIG